MPAGIDEHTKDKHAPNMEESEARMVPCANEQNEEGVSGICINPGVFFGFL